MKIAGGVTTYYYWGIGEKVSGSWTKLFVSGLGGKLVEYTSSSTQFFVTNHLGSVAARMSISGSLSETYRFLPFGERYAGTQTTHQFTGKERDQESGLDYFGARYLASNHGRWMGVDPKLGDRSNPQRLNRYGYVLNNPTYYFDPNGRQEQAIDEGDMKNCHRDETGKMNCDSGMTVTGEFDRVDPMPSSIGTWAPGGSGFQGPFVGSSGSSSAPGGGSGGTATPVDSHGPNVPDSVLCFGGGGSFTLPGGIASVGADGNAQMCITLQGIVDLLQNNIGPQNPASPAVLAVEFALGEASIVPSFQEIVAFGQGITGGASVTWSPAGSIGEFTSGMGWGVTGCYGTGYAGCVTVMFTTNSDGSYSFNGIEVVGGLGVASYISFNTLGASFTIP